MDKYDKLKELKEMFDNGLLEESEFNKLKKQILFKTETDNENDAELPRNYVSDYQSKSEKPKRMSTSATILYTIIGIALFAFAKKTFFKADEPIQITTENRSAELENNNYTNEHNESKGNTNKNNSYQNNNNSIMNNNGYHMGRDGRVYENSACSLCKGTGVETGRNIATGELEGRICPMCDGRGVRSY
ncbi:hypothetical protein GGR22_000714 [Flavobacterium gossypii]|uniref:SHOCT domain-containing protein n=1 Tax=Flavobacterium gossypii TaxID=1646119 RepID=A0ABR6DLM1_9FLAO|nr:SHOCT domain-containing protein [Flavobacterium gossypii]MBA9072588.1 hypothetical protein [Flavobacterium gossypii]